MQNPESRKRESSAEGLERGELRNLNHESQIGSRERQTSRRLIGQAKPFRRKALESNGLTSVLPRMRQGGGTNCGLWIGDCGLGTGRRSLSVLLETCLAATRRGARGNWGFRIADWGAVARGFYELGGLAGLAKVVSFMCRDRGFWV